MSQSRFECLLEQVMGLSAASIGSSAIERAVDMRRRALGLCDLDAYWRWLQGSPDEQQELVEAVVVPETWFFRNSQAFRAMVDDVLAPRLRVDPHAGLRLLSLPCSTGEEAYTMAMALLDSGIPAHRFSIEGVDISRPALEQARAGVYGRNSFRGHDLDFRDRHFAAQGQLWKLRDGVRASVRFSHGNIFAPGFMAQAAAFDVIFCRNLLIYFDPPRQKQAIAVLGRLLAPGGTLFVGHSEAGLMRTEGFVSAGMAMSFAFQRAPDPALCPGPFGPPPSVSMPLSPRPRRDDAPAVGIRRPARIAPDPRPPCKRPAPDLAALRAMADDGRVDEAERACQAHIRQHGASPDALLLLGLINDASGQTKAAAHYYRKVLYLDPGQAEAMGHLALLLRRQGDCVGAQRLDDRLRRRDERRNG